MPLFSPLFVWSEVCSYGQGPGCPWFAGPTTRNGALSAYGHTPLRHIRTHITEGNRIFRHQSASLTLGNAALGPEFAARLQAKCSHDRPDHNYAQS